MDSLTRIFKYLGLGFAAIVMGACITADEPGTARYNTSATKAKDTASVEEPHLVLEAEGHKAIIRELLFSADGNELVSVSDDKTIRVWNVSPDGRYAKLDRSIRGQIEDGRAGQLLAASLSPPNAQGRQQWLVVGGFLAGPTADRCAIRLHDYNTGDVRLLLRGHTDLVLALAFSPDGNWLASAGKDRTVLIWDMEGLEGKNQIKPIHKLNQHTEHIYDLAWSPKGDRLASASDDHTVALWDTSMLEKGQVDLIKRLKGHSNQVVTVAFHPDGSVLASGSIDKTIRLWQTHDGKGIRRHFEAKHKISALSFSPDGKLLLAGNYTPPKPELVTIFKYPSGLIHHEFKNHHNLVIATAFHPSGQWVATGGGEQKEILLWHAHTGQVLSRLGGKGRTIYAVGFSKDGRFISWGHTSKFTSINNRGPLEHRFDLTELVRLPNGLQRKSAVTTMDHMGKFKIAPDFRKREDYNPYRLLIKRDGKKLSTIERGSMNGYWHSAYTFTSDGQYVLSGGQNGDLRLYSLDGKTRAKLIGHTGEIKAVAVSADGRWALSGAVDQTLNLWSLTELPDSGNKKLLPTLTLFPATDGEWVARIPEGFYTASPNGDEYVGWRINQGVDQTEAVVRIRQLGQLYYRPDLVAKRLEGGFEKQIQAELKQTGSLERIFASGLPPKVRILSKPVAILQRTDLDIEIEIEAQGGGIDDKIKYSVNGTVRKLTQKLRDYAKGRANLVNRFKLTIPVTLVNGRNEIVVTAYNKAGKIESAPARYVQYVKDPLAIPASLYVLAIGISKYYDSALHLMFAHKDAEDLAALLQSRGQGLFKVVHPITLVNEQATTSVIRKTFNKLGDKIQTNDVFLLYMAGHGIIENGRYHFIPYELEYGNREMLISDSISADDLEDFLKTIPALKSLVLLDTCYSGALVEDKRLMAFMIRGGFEQKTVMERLMRATGRSYITASRKQAIEGYEGHGVLTHALLRGLNGEADRSGKEYGTITIDELSKFVRAEVPRITMVRYGYRQIPMSLITDDPFPISCREGFDEAGCKQSNQSSR